MYYYMQDPGSIQIQRRYYSKKKCIVKERLQTGRMSDWKYNSSALLAKARSYASKYRACASEDMENI